MSAENILPWGAMLGVAYIAGAAIYFELASSKSRGSSSAKYGSDRHYRARQVKTKP